MTKNETEAIWAEIEQLRAELNALVTKRELLAKHATELRRLHGELKGQAQGVEAMADEIEKHLGGME